MSKDPQEQTHETHRETHKVQLYYKNSCGYCHYVIDFINQEGLEVELIDVAKDRAAFKYLERKGGKTQVPCLFIDGSPLYESKLIISWLDQHRDSLPSKQSN
ncbi:MAG: hypothetical protein S4CHLAM102_00670 [Chlamydiia bacterium]|nr:hypothetical protein [Chlamydiia bacterium]